MPLTFGGVEVAEVPQPTVLSQDERDRAQVALEKCLDALWRFEAISARLRKRELWLQRNAGHPQWQERKQAVFDDLWSWWWAWEAFSEATERLDGVLHRWPEDQQQTWMAEEGITGRSVLAPKTPQFIGNYGWATCHKFLDGPVPF